MKSNSVDIYAFPFPAFDALSFLELKYIPPTPYNVVLTEPIIAKYRDIFSFMLVLQRTRIGLEKICTSQWWRDLAPGTRRRQRDPCPAAEQEKRAWSAKESAEAQRLFWVLRAFTNGMLRYAHQVGISEVWRAFEHDLEKGVDENAMDLAAVYRLHRQTLDIIHQRLLLRPNQRPLMKVVRTLIEIAINFTRTVVGTDKTFQDSPRMKIEKALAKVRVAYAVLVKTMRKLSESAGHAKSPKKGGWDGIRAVDGKVNEFYTRLLLEIDGNGFVEDVEQAHVWDLQAQIEA